MCLGRRTLPAPGPAVGPGAQAIRPVAGENFEAAAHLQFEIGLGSDKELALSESGFAKVPHALRLHAERPQGGDVRRYKAMRRNQELYRMASRMWGEGVDISRAIEIATEAVATWES